MLMTARSDWPEKMWVGVTARQLGEVLERLRVMGGDFVCRSWMRIGVSVVVGLLVESLIEVVTVGAGRVEEKMRRSVSMVVVG